MSLHPNWKETLKKAWSIRLMLMASVLSGAEAALPSLDGMIPNGAFAVASFFVTCLAMLARIVAQKEMSDGD